jgi:2-dehydro-3-deoxygluconokinase
MMSGNCRVDESDEGARSQDSCVIVSYDLNDRPSLWQARGGRAQAVKVKSEHARLVDVMIGNERDRGATLDLEVDGLDAEATRLDTGAFKQMIERAVRAYPRLKVVATTLRSAESASFDDWGR